VDEELERYYVAYFGRTNRDEEVNEYRISYENGNGNGNKNEMDGKQYIEEKKIAVVNIVNAINI
jgi:hypothetical protein